MVKRIHILFLFLMMSCMGLMAQYERPHYVYFYQQDTVPKPMKAFLFSQLPNFTIYSINRYIKKSDFAMINRETIMRNFMFTSVWDNDLFGTNQLAHPFHGALDFTGARVSGMNFYQSIPYTVLGSFVWEFALENEPMSFNDQITTSVGGLILGEASLRMSSAFINNQATGWNRVWREAVVSLLCPMQGINRLVTGEMWKRKPVLNRVYPANRVPVFFGAEMSMRYLKGFYNMPSSGWMPQLNGWLVYGSPYRKSNYRPMDYFRFDFNLNLSGKTSILSELNVVGLWWGRQLETKSKEDDWMWGVFQHFYYKDKEGLGPDTIPAMRFSEPASIGVGTAFRRHNLKTNSCLRASAHVNAVLLAAAHATNFDLKGRQYNYGQGYSIKLHLNYGYHDRFICGVSTNFLHFFTWEGYPTGLDTSIQDIQTFRAMGDKGHTMIHVIKPYWEWRFTRHWAIHSSQTLFLQDTFNKDYGVDRHRFYEVTFGIKCTY